MKKVYIQDVEPNSVASGAQIEPGDFLIKINGQTIQDVFDYRYLCNDDFLVLEIEKKNGQLWEIEIEKEEDMDLGLVFENDLIDQEKQCANDCIFCFIDQLPPSMRKTLYFKDDDARLSFLTGNYVTLTNMGKKGLERIAKLRLSPVNLSIHSTEPDIRKKMLGNEKAGDILEKIAYLAKEKIQMNGQVVLIPNINDQEHLQKTITDLEKFHPFMQSLSIVPVGITKHRDNLYPLTPFDTQTAKQVVDQVTLLQKEFFQKHHCHFVYLADEFYLMANQSIPDSTHYDGFPQIENGVGLIACLRDEITRILDKCQTREDVCHKATIATGLLARPFIRSMVEQIQRIYPNVDVDVVGVRNHFFGDSVTVAGLLTGSDILKAFQNKKTKGKLLITECMLKSNQDVFLDDVTLKECEKTLNTKIQTVQNTGKDFIEKITGGQSHG